MKREQSRILAVSAILAESVIHAMKREQSRILVVSLPPPQAFQKNKMGAKRTERPAD
jgi:hypothetical protein